MKFFPVYISSIFRYNLTLVVYKNKLGSKRIMEKLLAMWSKFSVAQKTISVLSAVLATTLVVGGGILISNAGKDANAPGTESGTETEVFGTEEVFMTEMTEETEMEVIETISVMLYATSIEKDLKIKILDENDVRVKGQNFVITVTPEGSKEGKEYNDHDQDGIIYMKSMTPGKYTVQLHEIEGYVPVENPITATVKEKIAYEKVDMSNEIKDDSEISETEKNPNNGESTANQIKDTVEYVEKHKYVDEITKDQVVLVGFVEAKKSSEKNTVTFESADISLPKTATLYTSGQELAKTIELNLEKNDTEGIIKDIQWQVNGTAVECVAADDKMSAKINMKSAGTAKVAVIVTYEKSVAPETTGDTTSEGNSVGLSSNMEGLPTVTTETATVECTVSVENQPDAQTQLKDANGKLLYVDADGKTPATPANYASAEKFYTAPRYTGWQEIDGKTFFFKKDHTYVTGKQIIGGVEYEFDETGYLITRERSIGIDVSKWNGEVDWAKVASDPANIDFAIIRCGNRYGKSGDIAEDPYFKKNIEGAIKNGIKVGVYFFSQAITKAEAVEEASAALELVKGYNLQLPIYIDTEGLDGGRANNLSKEERTEILKTFCEVIKNAGYKPGVYSGAYWYRTHVIASEIEQYHIWVAQYNKELTYQGRYDIWQYTSDGSISGIKGRVDMNIAYRVYY